MKNKKTSTKEISVKDVCINLLGYDALIKKCDNSSNALLRGISDVFSVVKYALNKQRLTLDEAFEYAKKRGFMFYDLAKGCKRIVFYKNRRAWICWCCGRVRYAEVKSEIEERTMKAKPYETNGFIFPTGVYIAPTNRLCKHHNTKTHRCTIKNCIVTKKRVDKTHARVKPVLIE